MIYFWNINWFDLFFVCVCVLEILVLKFFKLTDYFERFMCWLDHWLSCMLDCIHICVFLHSKNCFEKLARQLLDTSSILCYLSSFSSIFLKRNLDTSSIPSGSIEKAPASSIAPRHLLDPLSFCSWICSLFLDSFLDTLAIKGQILDNFLDTSRYLSCRALLKLLYISQSQFFSHFFDLSWSVHDCSSPKHSPFHSKPLPQGFFMLFQVFLHLVSF